MALSENDLRTRFSLEAKELSAALNSALGRITLRPHDYRPELTSPEGPSTGGGVQALQHLRLVCANAQIPAILVGWANRAEKSAELRSYDHVDGVHRERFGKPVDLNREDYEQFLQMAMNLFEAVQLETRIAVSATRSIRPPVSIAVPGPARPSGVMVGFIVGALVATVISVVVFLALRH